MNTTTKIPKFRTVKGLIRWVVDNSWTQRLDPEREQVFFKESDKSASSISQYAEYVGKLDLPLERIISKDPVSIANYQKKIYGSHGLLPEDLLSTLKGKGRLLVSVARVIGRLPDWLEDTIEEPDHLLTYSKTVLKGPLPANLLEKLKKDVNTTIRYAYEVVRGFAPCRLPDELHTFVVLKSFEDPENQQIKKYVMDSRKFPETNDAEE